MSQAQEDLISQSAIVRVAPEQLSRDLDGEIIILNLCTGTYYGLEHVGARIWGLIQEPRTVAQLRDALVAEYEVSREQCDIDLQRLLQELLRTGLITVEGERR
jgi:hypothetical protein